MKTQIKIDIIFAVLFFVLFVVALVGIFRGVWWHIGTAAICFTMLVFILKDIKKCREED